MRNRDGVGLGLTDDAEANSGAAIGADGRGAGGGVEDDAGDVAETGAAIDDDAFEIAGLGDFGDGADRNVLIGAVDGAGGGIEGDRGQGISDIGYREAVAREFYRIDIYFEGGSAGAVDLHLGDAFDGGEALCDNAVDQFAEVGNA